MRKALATKRMPERKWKPAELRAATLGLLAEQGVESGYWGACTIDPQSLIDQGFPEAFVQPMIEDFRYEPDNPHTLIIKHADDGTSGLVSHVRAVSILRVLRALAQVFGVDTADADRQLGRKNGARMLAASIKASMKEEERINQ